MSNPNISTRRTTFNKISAESPFINSAFIPLKSPNFPQSPSKMISQGDDFEAPKPTKKIKSGKSAENGAFMASSGKDWPGSFLPSSAQLDELIKKQAPDFLDNIQLKVVDENWEREALKQINNSSLHKLLNSNTHGLDAFKAEGAFKGDQQTPLELLEPREIIQLIDKMNQNLKQEVPHFPQAQDKLPLGQLMIPDLPLDLQNALDELLYQTPIVPQTRPSKKLQAKEKNKSYIHKTNGSNDSHEAPQESLESPQNTNKRPTRNAQLKLAKSKAEKTAANETKNFPPKELLGKRSPPQTDQEPQNQASDEPQRRTTRRSQQTPQNQQTETPPKVTQTKSKNTVKSPPQLEKKNSEEEKVTKKKTSAKQNKTENAQHQALPNFDRISTDDDSLEMPFKNSNKKTAAGDEGGLMEIENTEPYVQRTVNIKIGNAHQINPLPLVLNKERPHRQIKKIVWSPPSIEVKVYEDYIEQFQKVIEKEITNVEVACKTLIKFDMDINKAIENIKKNVAYYKNQMIPGQRVLRNRFTFSS